MPPHPQSGTAAQYQPSRVPTDLAHPGAALTLWNALAPLAQYEPPAVRACMVATPDGAVTVDGLSGGLGTPMDHAVYHTMRMRSDLIIASMSTVRAEHYGPATVFAHLAHLRNAAPSPIWAITRTLRAADIDYIAGAQHRHSDAGAVGAMEIVVAESGADPALRARAAERGVAVRIIAGTTADFVANVVAAARREASHEVVVESGPRLLARLLAAGVLAELVLSVSPKLHLPTGTRLLPEEWQEREVARRLRVVSAFSADDGGLYTRWAIADTVEEQE